MSDWPAALDRLAGAYAPATVRAYRADIRDYVGWCDAHAIAPFPATVETLCDYLAEDGLTSVPSTVKRRLCAIRKIHRLLALPDPTSDEAVNLVLRRLGRQSIGRPRQARGLNRPVLEQFLRAQPDTPWGLRNAAMLSLGYELMTRRSELVALRDPDLDWQKDGTLRVLIRRSKTDQAGLGRVAFTSADTARRLHAWLERRGDRTQWLFCPIYKGHVIDRGLSDSAVKTLVKTSAEAAGYTDEDVFAFSGHSMRVGAAQDLLTRGFDSIAIMRAGGWKSPGTLARYLEIAQQNVWVSA